MATSAASSQSAASSNSAAGEGNTLEYIGLYYQEVGINLGTNRTSTPDRTESCAVERIYGPAIGDEIVSILGVHGESSSSSETARNLLGLYQYDIAIDQNDNDPGTLVAQITAILPTGTDGPAAVEGAVSFTLVPGKYYLIGALAGNTDLPQITNTQAQGGVFAGNYVRQTVFGSSAAEELPNPLVRDANSAQSLVIWAVFTRESPTGSPTLTTYDNQEFTLGDTINLGVSGNWTNVDPNSFTSPDMPIGLSLSATGTITGPIRVGGIIGCNIHVVGLNGQKLSAGFTWYERL